MPYRGATVLLPFFVLTACSNPTDPNPPPPPPPVATGFRVTPVQLWAGTPLRIESAAFRTLGEGAKLRFGLTDLPLSRVDDTTLTVVVPSAAGGIYDPVVVMGDSLAPLAQITVWGFATTRRFGPDGVWLPWDIYPWPRGEAKIVGGTLTGALVLIDLGQEVTRTLPGMFAPNALRGPGATPEDSVFLLRPQGQPLQSWKFGAIPEKLGEHPEIGGNRQVLRLGLHSWLVTWNNRVDVWWRADSSTGYTVAASYPINSPQGVHLSPRKDRATVRANWSGGGTNLIPVFDVPSGDLAFHVPIASAMGVDWSVDGALMAVVGGTTPYDPMLPGTVLLLDAGIGEIRATAFTELEVFAVAFDDRRPYLYVGVTTPSGHLAVEVYTRPGLMRLARLEVPANDPICSFHGGGCAGGVLAPGSGELHAFYGWNGLTRSSRFFLPPP